MSNSLTCMVFPISANILTISSLTQRTSGGIVGVAVLGGMIYTAVFFKIITVSEDT